MLTWFPKRADQTVGQFNTSPRSIINELKIKWWGLWLSLSWSFAVLSGFSFSYTAGNTEKQSVKMNKIAHVGHLSFCHWLCFVSPGITCQSQHTWLKGGCSSILVFDGLSGSSAVIDPAPASFFLLQHFHSPDLPSWPAIDHQSHSPQWRDHFKKVSWHLDLVEWVLLTERALKEWKKRWGFC